MFHILIFDLSFYYLADQDLEAVGLVAETLQQPVDT